MKKANSSDTQNSSITRARESNALTFAQVLAARLDADGGAVRARLADALLAKAEEGDLKAVQLVLEIGGENRRESQRIARIEREEAERIKAEHMADIKRRRDAGEELTFDEYGELMFA